jgi:DNA-binding FrmR family transcriptional regulator
MRAEEKQDAGRRLNRIAGQVAGIQRMVEADRYCVDILHQVAAVRAALDQLGVRLLTGHLESCVLGADPSDHRALLEEVRLSLSRFLK